MARKVTAPGASVTVRKPGTTAPGTQAKASKKAGDLKVSMAEALAMTHAVETVVSARGRTRQERETLATELGRIADRLRGPDVGKAVGVAGVKINAPDQTGLKAKMVRPSSPDKTLAIIFDRWPPSGGVKPPVFGRREPPGGASKAPIFDRWGKPGGKKP